MGRAAAVRADTVQLALDWIGRYIGLGSVAWLSGLVCSVQGSVACGDSSCSQAC
jgi:hypothetical protein